MKNTIFKKIIAGISALSMVGTLGFIPITASAAEGDVKTIYTQDFEDASSSDITVSGSAAATVAASQGTSLTSKSLKLGSGKSGSGAGNSLGYSKAFMDNSDPAVPVSEYKNITLDFDLEALQVRSDKTANINLAFADSENVTLFDLSVSTGSNLGSNTLTDALGKTTAINGSALHFSMELDFIAKTQKITVTDLAGAPVATVEAADIPQLNFSGLYLAPTEWRYGYCLIDNVVMTTVELGEGQVYYDVYYDVNGKTSQESILTGTPVQEIPNTDRIGYLFTGWYKDDDTTTLYSNDELAAMPITDETTFTAAYTRDPDYIEPIVKAEITGEDSMTFGPDPNTAADNPYSVTLTGEIGTVITVDNMDPRIEDFNVAWDIDGFATENDQPGQYCDSYGAFTVNNAKSTDTVFALRNVPMNFYGKMTATVTYNGTTIIAEKCVTALGDKSMPAGRILPEAGYPTDFSKYADAMAGYKAVISGSNQSGSDAILGNLFTAGSDVDRNAELAMDATGKYLHITKPTLKKSGMLAHSLDVESRQVIFSQKVRFNDAGGVITFTKGYPIWSSSGSYSSQASFNFSGTGASFNGVAITDSTDAATVLNTGVWYNVVISLDGTNYKAWAQVYDENGQLLGEAKNVAMTTQAMPTYYAVGVDNSASGSTDLAGYEIYYPTADTSTFTIDATQDTLSIPKGDTAGLSAAIKTSEGYDLTGAATWTVLEEDMQAGVIITPDENDSHRATVTLSEEASAGEATVQVNIGGYTKTIVLNITSSAESVKFTKSSSSVSIPLDDTSTTVEYAAAVVDGEGKDLGREVVFGVYDKNNSAEYTLPQGITFANGVLTVDKTAPACTFTIRATGANSDGASISKAIKVTVHGLSFDFGITADDAVAEGYTHVGADTTYTESRGYGISSGAPKADGAASTDNADSDWLNGSYTFKANVTKGKMYTVDITYSGTLTTAYVNSDLAGYTLGTNEQLTKSTYTFAVPTDVLDLTVANGSIASVTITKNADRTARTKPVIHHVGDSTAANNGSWAYHIDHNRASFPELDEIATFYNNGAGGRNLCTYYTEGKLAGVLNDIYPGDIIMFGNNGTNGMGNFFEEDVNYYIDAAEAMGAKLIINSYTPHGPVGGYVNGYDAATHTFNTWRQDSYDNIVREIAAEREANDPNYLGFVEIGKNADAAFNAYVADAADKDAAAQEIISCFSDHNHYSEGSKARDLMLNGYGDGKGIVEQIIAILSAEPAVRYNVTVAADIANGTVAVDKTSAKAGTVVSVTATPAEGYTLDKILVDGTAIEGTSFTMPEHDVTVSAVFKENTVAELTVSIEAADGKVKAAAKNVGDIKADLYIAVYEGGILKAVKKAAVDGADAETTAIEAASGQTVKAFLWKDMQCLYGAVVKTID